MMSGRRTPIRKTLFSSPQPRDDRQRTLPFSLQKRQRPSDLASAKIENQPIAGPSPKKKSRLKKPENDCTSESSLDSEEATDDSTFAKDSIQLMSIHRIVLDDNDRNRRRISGCMESELENEEEIITKIIGDYNDQQKSERKQNFEESFLFTEQPNKPICVASNAKGLMVGSEFKNRLYVQETFATNNLLRWYGVASKFQTRNIHMVLFLFRQGEIYALTTNQAWNVVHKYSDFEFPGKIAARLCSEDGARYTDDKVLIGNLLQNTKLMKDGQSPSANDVPVLCTSFTAELRATASIFKFPCFEKERETFARASIQFGFGYLRFKKHFTIPDLPLILDHLSIIAQGLATEKIINAPSVSSGNAMTENNRTSTRGQGNEGELQPPNNDTTVLTSSDDEDQENNEIRLDSGFATRESATFRSPSYHRDDNSETEGSDHHSHSDISDSNPCSSNFNTQGVVTASQHANNAQYSQDSLLDDSQQDILFEKDTHVYQRNFSKLPKEMNSDLDEVLARKLSGAIRGRRMGELNSFALSYRYTKDFAMAVSVSLSYKATKISLPVHSTLTDIVNAIATNTDKDIDKLKKIDEIDRKKLKDEMKQIKIQYTLPEGKDEIDSLFNFMEGELIHDGYIYWRVMRQWCSVNKYYLLNTHYWFQSFLEQHLIRDQDAMALPIKWPNEKKIVQFLEKDPAFNIIQYYTSLFEDQEGFYKPPSGKFNGKSIQLFDLLHHDRDCRDGDRIIIYFFANNFAGHTSKICERIHRCRQEIQKALNNKSTGLFKKFFKQNFLQPQDVFVGEHYKQFKGLLENCTLVYTLPNEVMEINQNGPINNYLPTPSSSSSANQPGSGGFRKRILLDESRVIFKVTLKELQKCLRNASALFTREDMLMLLPGSSSNLDDGALKNACIKKILQELRDEKYIATIGQESDKVTEKFLYATESNFRLKCTTCSGNASREEKGKMNTLRKKLFHNVLSKFRITYTSLRAKLELREVATNPKTKFKMYEVEVDA